MEKILNTLKNAFSFGDDKSLDEGDVQAISSSVNSLIDKVLGHYTIHKGLENGITAEEQIRNIVVPSIAVALDDQCVSSEIKHASVSGYRSEVTYQIAPDIDVNAVDRLQNYKTLLISDPFVKFCEIKIENTEKSSETSELIGPEEIHPEDEAAYTAMQKEYSESGSNSEVAVGFKTAIETAKGGVNDLYKNPEIYDEMKRDLTDAISEISLAYNLDINNVTRSIDNVIIQVPLGYTIDSLAEAGPVNRLDR